MIEQNKSIWHSDFDSYWRVIPINTVVRANGFLVMGTGLAKQAAERHPELPEFLGDFYRQKSRIKSICYISSKRLVAFPTKIHFINNSNLSLIEVGLIELKELVSSEFNNGKIASPRLGCDLGNLDWKKDVKPLVEKYFGDDDNFIIASL